MKFLSKIIVVCLMVISAGLTAAESATEEKKPVLETEMQKVSYIYGTMIAGQFKDAPFDLETVAFLAGIKDVLEGKDPAIPQQEQQAVMAAFQQKMMAEQQKKAQDSLFQNREQPKDLPFKLVDFDKNKDYFWVLETSKGKIKIKFMPEVAPYHVSSTIYLTNKKFYDGLIFHRVIKGFMAQGGCPDGTGTGGPGYSYEGEFDRSVTHNKPYLLSMANTGRPTSDGSQFFITFVPTPHLDGKHTIFGEVVEGQKVVDAIEKVETAAQDRPVEEIKIIKATIEEAKK